MSNGPPVKPFAQHDPGIYPFAPDEPFIYTHDANWMHAAPINLSDTLGRRRERVPRAAPGGTPGAASGSSRQNGGRNRRGRNSNHDDHDDLDENGHAYPERPKSPTQIAHGPPVTAAPILLPAQQELSFLQRYDEEVENLYKSLHKASTSTATRRSTRDVHEYARSRGRPNGVGMRAINEDDMRSGQVWRSVVMTVSDDFLKLPTESKRSNYSSSSHYKLTNARNPYKLAPATLHPTSRVVWRDLYDYDTYKMDILSQATAAELAAAGRAAYNWLSRRHRPIISADFARYLHAVLSVAKTGVSAQYRTCAIDTLPLCTSEIVKSSSPDSRAAEIWFALLLRESAETPETSGGDTVILDHQSQIAMLHVRGSWGGDVTVGRCIRRRSELLNFVPHDTIVVAHGEIRLCPCMTDRFMTHLPTIQIQESHVRESDNVLRNPGLVSFPFGRLIFLAYIVLFFCSLAVITWQSTKPTNSNENSNHLDRITSVLGGWTWSLALVTGIHVIIIKNVLPNIELRELSQGLRHAQDLDDMRLSDGALICLAQDARTNHLLAPGNACAYAHRPFGHVKVSTLPAAMDIWRLGLIVTDKFAIKLDEGTPIIRKTRKNLDGSVHVDWDIPIRGTTVGHLLDNHITVG